MITPSKAAKSISKAKRTGSALKSDIYHRAASYLSQSQMASHQLFKAGGIINGKPN